MSELSGIYNNYKGIKIISSNVYCTFDGADSFGPKSELKYYFLFYRDNNKYVIDVWYSELWYGYDTDVIPENIDKFESNYTKELIEKFLNIYDYTTYNYSKTKGWVNKIKQKYK